MFKAILYDPTTHIYHSVTVGPALGLKLGKEPPVIKFRQFGDAKLLKRARWCVMDMTEVYRDLWEL